jgi:hypothetical protein
MLNNLRSLLSQSAPTPSLSVHTKMTSSPGQIFLSGIVVLANPRAIDPSRGNRNIAFDVNFPIVDGVNHQSLGLLCYFTPENRINDLDKVWEKRFTQAFIISKVRIPYHRHIFHSLFFSRLLPCHNLVYLPH